MSSALRSTSVAALVVRITRGCPWRRRHASSARALLFRKRRVDVQQEGVRIAPKISTDRTG
jgi:hypothetical protein